MPYAVIAEIEPHSLRADFTRHNKRLFDRLARRPEVITTSGDVQPTTTTEVTVDGLHIREQQENNKIHRVAFFEKISHAADFAVTFRDEAEGNAGTNLAEIESIPEPSERHLEG